MSDQVLESAISKILRDETLGQRIEFLWHAGEPLTAGLPFFQRAVALIEKHSSHGKVVVQAVQTNGTLVDRDWCRFFLDNSFKIGVSLDGPSILHDKHRVRWNGKGSLEHSLRGFHRLQDAGLNPGALTVITNDTLDHPDELFNFYAKEEIRSVGFNVEEVENAHHLTTLGSNGASPSKSLRVRYRRFIDRIIELWWPCRDSMSIREIRDAIDAIASKKVNGDYTRIPDESRMLGIITIQKNGTLTTYSPEFAGARSAEFNDFAVGNVLSIKAFSDILSHPTFVKMHEKIEAGRRACAEKCRCFDFCGSAFLSNRYFETGHLDGTESTTCILQRQISVAAVINKLQIESINRVRLHVGDQDSSS